MMYIDKTDSIGTSLSTSFDIELVDETVKPVCHDLRRYSKKKTEFIDEEVKKMQ